VRYAYAKAANMLCLAACDQQYEDEQQLFNGVDALVIGGGSLQRRLHLGNVAVHGKHWEYVNGHHQDVFLELRRRYNQHCFKSEMAPDSPDTIFHLQQGVGEGLRR
jgi:hypothetical protein